MDLTEFLKRVARTQRATIADGSKRKYPYKDALLAAVLIRIAAGKQVTPEVVLDGVLRHLYERILADLFPYGPSGPPDQPFRHLEESRAAGCRATGAQTEDAALVRNCN